jgi:hypothetical protein
VRQVDQAGPARLELVSGVVQLHPQDAMVEAMLRGWRAQQAARGLREDTIVNGERLATPSCCLFPGGQPGRPISAERLKLRLNRLGIRPNQARSTALFQLATEIPAAILARTLGISVNSAVRWQQISAGDWASYAADVSNRSRPQRSDPTDRR